MKICGIELEKFAVKSLCMADVAEAFCEKTGLKMAEEGAENLIILNGESLDYAPYSIEIGKEVKISGSYRSLFTALDAFYALLEKDEINEADSLSGKIEKPEIPYKNREDLLKIINYMYEKDDRVLFGQHLAGRADLSETIKDYTESVGVGPSMLDYDMIQLHGRTRAEWSLSVCQIVEFAAKGGIITTMHHWINPIDPSKGYRGRLGNNDTWLEVLTPGTELNKKWVQFLDYGGEFMKALWNNGVTVMWRPLHEANGNWFWFCQGQGEEYGNITMENMVKMWKYVYNYYTKDFGLDQLVWSYGPNVSSGLGAVTAVNSYYPGDDYVDVVGFDWYTNNHYEFDCQNYEGKCHDRLVELGKPFGIMEWGINGEIRDQKAAGNEDYFTCEDYCKILDRMKSEGKKVAFCEVYSGIYGSVKYVGKGEALYKSGWVVALHEMPELIKKILSE